MTSGINRTQIEREVSDALGGDKEGARIALDTIVHATQRTLAEGGRVHITGIGSLTPKVVSSRWVTNPATGKKVKTKKKGKVQVRPGRALQEVIAGKRKVVAASKGREKTASKG